MATGTLTNSSIKDRYKSLLKLSGTANDVLAADAAAKGVEDGDGNDSALALSTNRVGIGTTTPTNTLTVQSASGTSSFKTGDGTRFFRVYQDSTNISLAADWSVNLDFYVGGSQRLKIATDGKVGIGTGSPARKLSVNSGEIITAMFESTSNQSRVSFNDSGTSGNNYVGAGSSGDNLTLFAGAAEKARLTSGGKLGIGTTSPARHLHINGGGTNVLASFESTDAGAYLSFSDDSTTNDISVRLGANGNDFQFFAGGSERVRIDSTGKVGIGTTSPNALLHVKSTGNGEIEVERASGALVNIQAQSAKGVIGTDSNHPLSLKTNAGERVHITSGGNVGINTTSPSQKLDVEGVIKQKVYTVAYLPTAGSSTAGARAFVSDSTYAFSSSYLGYQVSGGGSNFVPVYSDGNYWYIG